MALGVPNPVAGALIVGKYKLLQQIGEGGMGSVWMADQTEPVKRRVAVKLIRVERGSSKTILSRFEAERQAIALMDHPNIAKLLDAGTTEAGQPYFVMELVKGVPLTEYCDTHKLDIPERLNLFMQICSAVQHAHQKGIIHRDLKPTNILVESHDSKPVPKVIDFGLAKATSGMQLTEHTLFTAFGHVMGTPQYMAPEQAKFNAVDVDTRADIYALGVILYELLTGSTPIARDTIKKAAFDEMLKLIREQEAPRPSSRLSVAGTSPNVAANRQMEPTKLGRFVKGELDWIVLKALSKERDRRYETATGFARDIQRFLNHEPVTAGPPSTSYRLRKFVRRNRVQVVAASVVVFVLLGGIAGTTFGLIRANRAAAAERLAWVEANEKRWEAEEARRAESERAEGERQAKQEAEAKRAEAERQKTRAESGEKLAGERLVLVGAEQKKAEAEKQIAQAVQDFLQNKLLSQADVGTQAYALLRAGELSENAKQNPTIRELLDRAAKELTPEKIETNFPNQALVQAAILRTVGNSYFGVGELERASSLLKRSLILYEQQLGDDHNDTLVCMTDLARAYMRAANQLSVGNPERALPLFEKVARLRKATLGSEHPVTLRSMHDLAMAYLHCKRLDLALPLAEEVVKLQKAQLGPEHLDTIATMGALATIYKSSGKLHLAIPLFEETFKLQKIKLGPEHVSTLGTMGLLAQTYQAAGKPDLAIANWEVTLRIRRIKLGTDHPQTRINMNNLALAYQAAGKLDKALPLFEESLILRKAKLEPDNPHLIMGMRNLAQCYQAVGKLDKALPLFEEMLALRIEYLGPDHPDTLMTMAELGSCYNAAGRYSESVPLLEEAYRVSWKHPTLRWVGNRLLNSYQKCGGVEPSLISQLISDARQQFPKDGTQLADQLAQISSALLLAKAFTEAEPLLRECLAIREKNQPDAWATFNARSLLGGALLGQKKYDEAEPLLLNGYEGLKLQEKSIPPTGNTRMPEALDRLIQFYMASNKPDEVKKWRAERSKYPPPVAPMPRATK